MKRRPRRSTPATLTALVLLAACVFAAAVAIQLIFGQTPWVDYRTIARALHDTHWNDLGPALAGGAAALCGLVMLLSGMLPGKPTILPLRGDPDSDASRRSHRSTLRSTASTVDGVAGVKLKLRNRKVTVTVSTGRTTTDGLADAVGDAVTARIGQIDPVTHPAVKVKVHAARSAL